MTNSIEVREGWKKYYLICFFAFFVIFYFGFIIPEQRKESIDFFSKWSFAKLPFFLMFAFVPSLCLFYYFDKRIKVRIDNDGIGLLNMAVYPGVTCGTLIPQLLKCEVMGDIYKLHIRLKDTEDRLDKEVTLKFRRIDKSFDEVRAVVEYYAGKYQIENLGYESEV